MSRRLSVRPLLAALAVAAIAGTTGCFLVFGGGSAFSLRWAISTIGEGTSRALTASSAGHDGCLVVAGLYQGHAEFGSADEDNDIFVIPRDEDDGLFLGKWDADGNLMWIEGANGNGNAGVYDITAQDNGEIVATGPFQGEMTFFGRDGAPDGQITSIRGNDGWIAKYDQDGNSHWRHLISGLSSNAGSAVGFGGGGDLYWAGEFDGTASLDYATPSIELHSLGGTDAFLVRIERDGSLGWTTTFGGAGIDSAWDLTVLSDGTVVVVGFFQSDLTFDRDQATMATLNSLGGEDIFIAGFDPNEGTLKWAKRVGGTGNQRAIHVTAIEGTGFAVTGNLNDTAVFGAGEANQTELTSAGSIDAFLAAFDQTGSLLWATRAGGSGADYGKSLAARDGGGLIWGGTYNGTAAFGSREDEEPIELIATGNDGFIAAFDTEGWLIDAMGINGPGDDRTSSIALLSDGSYAAVGMAGAPEVTLAAGKPEMLNIQGESKAWIAVFE